MSLLILVNFLAESRRISSKDFVLLETGSAILLEDGSNLLLE